jgi:MOSC domain-containing protein YiiM
MQPNQAVLHSIYVGQPKTLHDAQGEWRSTVYRDPVTGPVTVELRGIVGDQCTQPYHHGIDCALCVHLLDHYRFWNEAYGMTLQPGNVGENFVLAGVGEDEVCLGDIVRLGSTLVQVSCPRIPCANQARRVGRADWIKLTLAELRPGFYLRVLEPGVVQPGDAWQLEERLNPDHSLLVLNRCWYHDFQPDLARQFATLPGLSDWWQGRFAEKLQKSHTETKGGQP